MKTLKLNESEVDKRTSELYKNWYSSSGSQSEMIDSLPEKVKESTFKEFHKQARLEISILTTKEYLELSGVEVVVTNSGIHYEGYYSWHYICDFSELRKVKESIDNNLNH